MDENNTRTRAAKDACRSIDSLRDDVSTYQTHLTSILIKLKPFIDANSDLVGDNHVLPKQNISRDAFLKELGRHLNKVSARINERASIGKNMPFATDFSRRIEAVQQTVSKIIKHLNEFDACDFVPSNGKRGSAESGEACGFSGIFRRIFQQSPKQKTGEHRVAITESDESEAAVLARCADSIKCLDEQLGKYAESLRDACEYVEEIKKTRQIIVKKYQARLTDETAILIKLYEAIVGGGGKLTGIGVAYLFVLSAFTSFGISFAISFSDSIGKALGLSFGIGMPSITRSLDEISLPGRFLFVSSYQDWKSWLEALIQHPFVPLTAIALIWLVVYTLWQDLATAFSKPDLSEEAVQIMYCAQTNQINSLDALLQNRGDGVFQKIARYSLYVVIIVGFGGGMLIVGFPQTHDVSGLAKINDQDPCSADLSFNTIRFGNAFLVRFEQQIYLFGKEQYDLFLERVNVGFCMPIAAAPKATVVGPSFDEAVAHLAKAVDDLRGQNKVGQNKIASTLMDIKQSLNKKMPAAFRSEATEVISAIDKIPEKWKRLNQGVVFNEQEAYASALQLCADLMGSIKKSVTPVEELLKELKGNYMEKCVRPTVEKLMALRAHGGS